MSLKHVSKLIVSGGLILNSIGVDANADGNVLTEKRRESLAFTRSKEQAFPAYKGKSGSIETVLLK